MSETPHELAVKLEVPKERIKTIEAECSTDIARLAGDNPRREADNLHRQDGV